MNTNELIQAVLEKLKKIPNIIAIVLGGSYASGTERADSDIDISLYYEDKKPFKIEEIRKLAVELNDTPNPIVSDFGGWGHWVNGGTWLTIKGQRMDFIYRNLTFVKKIIQDCKEGKIQSDYYQEPPAGFHSYMYLAEIQADKILFDPKQEIEKLKKEITMYPQKLKEKIINSFLWDTEFALSRAQKFAQREEIELVASSCIRIVYDLIQVLYALNEVYFISYKRIYKNIPTFQKTPNHFFEKTKRISSFVYSDLFCSVSSF